MIIIKEDLKNSRNIEMPNTIRGVTILSPGGNDTALVPSLYPPDVRQVINNSLMEQFSNVEQIGFYTLSPENPETDAQLVMAGGAGIT